METISISKAEYEMFLSFKNQFDFSKKIKTQSKKDDVKQNWKNLAENSLKKIWDNKEDEKWASLL